MYGLETQLKCVRVINFIGLMCFVCSFGALRECSNYTARFINNKLHINTDKSDASLTLGCLGDVCVCVTHMYRHF